MVEILGEEPLAAARREVAEETGHAGRLGEVFRQRLHARGKVAL